jgi:hypothetical protein
LGLELELDSEDPLERDPELDSLPDPDPEPSNPRPPKLIVYDSVIFKKGIFFIVFFHLL